MDAQFVMSAVSTVGFPIVACGVMGWFCNSLIKSMYPTLTNINVALEKVSDKLDNLEDSVESHIDNKQ